MQREVLAIIPARGRSKGIPRKNVRLFAGHPLLAFSVAAARQADGVTRTVVTTDDDEIAEVARGWGAETPFMRPAELAADDTADLPVFQHALAWLDEHEHYRPEVVVHLHVTTPVRPLGCVDQALRLLIEHPEADCIRSVAEAGQSPYKMWRTDADTGRLVPLLGIPENPEPFNTPRQGLPRVYCQTGHVNAVRPEAILGGSMSGRVLYPLVIGPRFLVDIDTPADWEYGEWLVARGVAGIVWPAAPAAAPADLYDPDRPLPDHATRGGRR
jgi:CMP-N-acetylneuraminic acid synthetase